MKYLPLFFLLLISCKDVAEPNIDLRVFSSTGDCFPPSPDSGILSSSTLYTGPLSLTPIRFCAGFCNEPITKLRVHKGVLRMSLEPDDYYLYLDQPNTEGASFNVKADSVSAGPVILRTCTSY